MNPLDVEKSESASLLHKSRRQSDTSYDEDLNHQQLHNAIRDLSYTSPRSSIRIREITSAPSFETLSLHLNNHYQEDTSECHICTIISCTICASLLFVVISSICVLTIMGSTNINPIDLQHATAHFNMTVLSKWSYADFVNPMHRQLAQNIANSFQTATSMGPDAEFDSGYTAIEPLFGRHQKH
eukprot:132732_1